MVDGDEDKITLLEVEVSYLFYLILGCEFFVAVSKQNTMSLERDCYPPTPFCSSL